MQKRFSKVLAVVAVLIFSFTITSIDASAQRRKRRHRRARTVITNPTIATPTTGQDAGDARVVSTADQTASDPEQTADSASAKKPAPKKKTEDMQETITNLSNQVNSLNEKLGQMRDEQRSLLDMERLTRSEQRAETMRAQLRDVEDKQGELESRLEETNYALKPENIERAVGMIGTTHPEEARDARRHQLETEKARLESQLATLETSRVRLEAAIATADREVDMLRERLDKTAGSDQTQTTINPTSDQQTEDLPPPKNPNPPQ